jgi:fibronectin-binding autotransporter adhesin
VSCLALLDTAHAQPASAEGATRAPAIRTGAGVPALGRGISYADRVRDPVAVRFAGGEHAPPAGPLGLTTTNTGELIFRHATDFTVDHIISGAGAVIKTGAAMLTIGGLSDYSGDTLVQGGRLEGRSSMALTKKSNYTIEAGATVGVSTIPGLVVTAGSIAGAGLIDIGSGARLEAGASNASTSFSGEISGGGALAKTGSGTLTLSSTNTFTGGTTVTGGKLVVNGSIAGSVTLSNGTLSGSGTADMVAVARGGTVAPGNSIGTFHVNGAVSFVAGSTYQVEVNAAGQSDRIVASGMATLAGGTVEVLAANGNYAAATNYSILTAAGGVTGRFAAVTSNLAFLTPSLSYGGGSVILTMTRNDNAFGPGGSTAFIAQTRNQGGSAVSDERLGAGNPVYDALISTTAPEARAGFDLLSGEAHAQSIAVAIGESQFLRDAVLGRLRQPLLTAPSPASGIVLWGEAVGGQSKTSADGNAASLTRRGNWRHPRNGCRDL